MEEEERQKGPAKKYYKILNIYIFNPGSKT